MTPILSETLAPPRTTTNGRAGSVEQAAEDVELASHQQPGHGRQDVGDALGRGVRAMGRAERVVDVDVGQRRRAAPRRRRRWPSPRRGSAGSRAAGPRRAVSARRPPRLRARRSRRPSRPACRAARRGARRPARAQIFDDLALRAARGATRARRRTAVEQVADRRQRGADARVVGDRRRPRAGR